jgi:hypothetical protein
MSMVPPILLKKLAQLRRRERLLRLVWGVARVLGLAAVALVIACLVDWTVDLWDETPIELREGMAALQIALVMVAAFKLVVLPVFKRLRNRRLALYVEDKRPELQHRLISALELNQPHAQTRGMSPEMLAAMTREAEEYVRPMAFSSLADHGRLKHSLWVIAPVLVLGLAFLTLFPETAWALLQRQMLQDVDIPRDISIGTDTAPVWPSGEEVLLRFKASGPGVANRSGAVRIEGTDGRTFRVPLTLAEISREEQAVYVARVPPASADFTYRAKLGDGKMRRPSGVHYVARPNVVQQDGYIVLPEYVGLRPDKTPYEQLQSGGEIVGMPGLSVRVIVKTQKPVVRAMLETFGTAYPVLSGPSGLTKIQENYNQLLAALVMPSIGSNAPVAAVSTGAVGQAAVPLRTFKQELSLGAEQVEWRFDLRATETSYRVAVFDEYGFESKTGTVRALKIEPEPAPVVVLHPERFAAPRAFTSRATTAEILDFEGMPLPIDDDGRPGPIKVSYEAFGPYGIGRAQLRIGVIRGANASSGDGDGDTKNLKIDHWVTLPLAELKSTGRVFDKLKGAFTDSPEKEQVPFYAVPWPTPAAAWPRVIAGGRFDYQTSKLLDDAGKPFAFKVDDQIVIYVEVFNQNPDPKKALMARSRLREKDVVTWDKFERWCFDTLQEANRIEALVQMQQQVYDRPWFSIFGFR